MQFKRITLCVALAFASNAFASETVTMPTVEVTADKLNSLPATNDRGLDADGLARKRIGTSDTASLLDGQPGVSLYRAGGVSSLPVIHGMADDRVRVKVDGMDLISACANHMNAPLSYIDPTNVGSVKVFAGITPVSVGGDSIGGTIQVDSAAPEFARTGESSLLKGQAGMFYRSNNATHGLNLSATIANEQLSVRYTGSTATAKNYKAANTFKAGAATVGSITNNFVAGDEIGSSGYQADNHALAFGLRHENHLVELKLGLQNIPYQSFPNQRMDMTGNDSQQINLRYTGQYDWGALEARAYNEHTQHRMQFLGDKRYWYGALFNVAGMPMDTDGQNTGLLIKGDMILSERDILRAGVEYQQYRLSDWWNPVTNSAMMSPNVFQNINNGRRDRADLFGEWEARWNQQWLSQLGLRLGTVKMDTGNVQGYNAAMYGAAATAFNALSHQHTDNNMDITALARYTPDERKAFEFGFAQKTRSPNLYERFAWSNSNSMVMHMNNWFGDGHGYVGNLNLKPEVASTLSGSASWHDAEAGGFEVKISPYYTHVQNYIDAATCVSVGKVCAARTDGFLNLSLSNQTARLYGADVFARLPLANSETYGSFSANGVLNYVNGKNLTTGDNLYNIMPLNAKLAIEQHLGNWTNTLEAKLVDSKTRVQAIRKELRTGGYALLNLHSSYDWKQIRFDAGVENLLNKFYADPLGGAYIGQGSTMSSNATAPLYGIAVPGMGRSINVGVTVKF
ncbi:MAG: TonB-dependent receptor plug domain-containing protein [Methylobacter sp.]|nr:TonB-dependent receptor plug domain-containing protein [Methylobacter sp.]